MQDLLTAQTKCTNVQTDTSNAQGQSLMNMYGCLTMNNVLFQKSLFSLKLLIHGAAMKAVIVLNHL